MCVHVGMWTEDVFIYDVHVRVWGICKSVHCYTRAVAGNIGLQLYMYGVPPCTVKFNNFSRKALAETAHRLTGTAIVPSSCMYPTLLLCII